MIILYISLLFRFFFSISIKNKLFCLLLIFSCCMYESASVEMELELKMVFNCKYFEICGHFVYTPTHKHTQEWIGVLKSMQQTTSIIAVDKHWRSTGAGFFFFSLFETKLFIKWIFKYSEVYFGIVVLFLFFFSFNSLKCTKFLKKKCSDWENRSKGKTQTKLIHSFEKR